MDDIFKKKEISKNDEITSENINKLPVEIKKENFFTKLINRFKKFLNKK